MYPLCNVYWLVKLYITVVLYKLLVLAVFIGDAVRGHIGHANN